MRAALGLVLVVALVALPPAAAEDDPESCSLTGTCEVDGPACDVLGADRCYVVQRLIDEVP